MELKLLQAVLTTTWLLSTGNARNAHYPRSFYWLDYFGGEMSKDVLAVDPYTTGELTYVGQLYTKQYELLPAYVRTSSPFATSQALTSVFTGDTQIKVLASQCNGNFRWIPTNSSYSYDSIKYLVPAGSEFGQQLYFGRYAINGTFVLGKLASGYIGITIPYEGRIVASTTNFSVLTYRPPSKYGCRVKDYDQGLVDLS